MACVVEARRAVQRAADQLGEEPAVIDADTVPPTKGQTDGWSVEVVLRSPDGIPPGVHRVLAVEGLFSRPQPTRGDVHRIVATV